MNHVTLQKGIHTQPFKPLPGGYPAAGSTRAELSSNIRRSLLLEEPASQMSIATPLTKFRQDIQGMRALAVGLVLVYHIWPSVLPGGYVGVDVFFVISGFLITKLLFDEATKGGDISVSGFYTRRVRRLLPAATLVFVVVGIAAFIFLPSTRWSEVATHLVASAFYVENFYLYVDSIDYLKADNPPSPFQHYWSLSIEEQFYLVVPFLILLTVRSVRKERLPLAIGLVYAIVLILSLWQSVSVTSRDPAGAYFLSSTRVWELALGGLLAVFFERLRVPSATGRAVISWGGMLAIVWSAWAYSDGTPFPGTAALIPCLGTAALLVGGAEKTAYGADRVLSVRPVGYVGDISYSLYLWHWPIIIFVGAHQAVPLDAVSGLVVVGAAVAAAAVTKRVVEDRFRRPRERGKRANLSTLGMAAVLLAASVAVAAALWLPGASRQPIAQIAVGDPDYPGALVYSTEIDAPERPMRPRPEHAVGDVASVYTDGCHVARPDVDPTPCIYAPPDGVRTTTTIVVAGDSHAAQWIPALTEIAKVRGWRIVTHTKSSCAFVDTLLRVASAPYPACLDWNRAVIKDILERQPDFVFTSLVNNHFAEGAVSADDNAQRLAAGLAQHWSRLGDAGIPVIAMRSTPRFPHHVPDCVAANIDNPSVCSGSPEGVLLKWSDVVPAAIAMVPSAYMVDMIDRLCTESVCPVIAGNILVYRDPHHISRTYMRTMAPALAERIDATGILSK